MEFQRIFNPGCSLSVKCKCTAMARGEKRLQTLTTTKTSRRNSTRSTTRSTPNRSKSTAPTITSDSVRILLHKEVSGIVKSQLTLVSTNLKLSGPMASLLPRSSTTASIETGLLKILPGPLILPTNQIQILSTSTS